MYSQISKEDATAGRGLRQFGPAIWIADGPPVSFLGFPYPTRMAVMKLIEGGLLSGRRSCFPQRSSWNLTLLDRCDLLFPRAVCIISLPTGRPPTLAHAVTRRRDCAVSAGT